MSSEPDSASGDAYNRAFPRCSGEIVGTLDADNLMLRTRSRPSTLSSASIRTAVAIYGAVQMIDASGKPFGVFVPEPFDQYAVMRCVLVPPMSTGYFHRRRCGSELRGDESFKTMQDFDLWLRLSDREIVRTTTVLGSTRFSRKSMSRNADNYEHFCAEKIAALEKFVAARPQLRPHRDVAVAGIYCWAAEAVLDIEGAGPRFESFLDRAAALYPEDERLQEVRDRASARSG